ncbi:MAG TPA: Ig-like domain-containing protein [Symbiobacteriaceae bacterium]|nr:Ig-like domain-containing protein [Symbiobacteriaceae bacterium]
MHQERTGAKRSRRTLWRRAVAMLTVGMALLACMQTMPAKASGPVIMDGDLFYTKYSGSPTVKKVAFVYDSSGFNISPPAAVANTNGADGVIFAPDGDLLVGGQGDRVHKVNPTAGTVTTRTAGGTAAFHMALDPSGSKAWSSGIPGGLAEVPLTPFANGIFRPLTGDDTIITSLAFDEAGNGYYTSSGAGGFGSVGRINMATFQTTRVLSNIPAAHGMSFDKHTGHLMLFGSNHVTQIDPATMAIVADRVFSGMDFDQGTVDSHGHMFVASNSGYLLFMDYAASGIITSPANYVRIQFLDSYLDDVAPLAGPGAQLKELQLQLTGGSTFTVGTTATATVTALDAGSNPMAGVPVTLTGTGVNPMTQSGTTDAAGQAVFSYTGLNAGDDTLVATGGGKTSNSATVHWILNCSPSPALGWRPPLSSTAPYDMPLGSTLDMRFAYGDCTGHLHDESVIIMVTDAANPNAVITVWVYGYDILIDDAAGEYRVPFHSGQYGLAPGQTVKVSVFMSDALAGEALIHLIP